MSTLTIPSARRSVTAHKPSAAQAVAPNIRALISPDFNVEIQETLGDRFIEYVQVENGEFNLDNTAWSVEQIMYFEACKA